MQAIVNNEYGSPDDLKLQEIDKPPVDDDGVLVQVRAASVNPADWHLMRGEPYLVRLMFGLRRPKKSVPGLDVAGHVEEIGANVHEFRRGDEVFGGPGGAFAQYVRGREKDYTVEDFTRSGRWHDLILNVAGNRSLSDLRRALTPKGTLVLVGGGVGREAGSGGSFGPLVGSLKVLVLSRFVGQRLRTFIAKIRKEDLVFLKELIEAGKVTPVIDRAYPLNETPEAIHYLEAGHARGKVVVTV